MRKGLFALAAALVMVVVAAAPAAAITKNYRQDLEHPFVGLVAFYDAHGEFVHRCTGELLAPTVLLTAGHCTDDETGKGVNASARVWFQQDAGAHYDPATEHDPVSGYPDGCAAGTLGTLCAESHRMFNYGFANFAGFPNIHDVGLVILDQPIRMPEYGTLARANTVDRLATKRGTQDVTLRVSGYGISYRLITPPKTDGHAHNDIVSFRTRLQADEIFTNLRSANSGGYTLVANGNGNDRGGTCNGDSGGPVFWPADSNQIVAVTSWGILNAGCRGIGYYYRTDRQPVIDWILDHAGDAAGQIVVG
jgi:secreted trypsin-like serine protease